jgi:hypothetical protein
MPKYAKIRNDDAKAAFLMALLANPFENAYFLGEELGIGLTPYRLKGNRTKEALRRVNHVDFHILNNSEQKLDGTYILFTEVTFKAELHKIIDEFMKNNHGNLRVDAVALVEQYRDSAFAIRDQQLGNPPVPIVNPMNVMLIQPPVEPIAGPDVQPNLPFMVGQADLPLMVNHEDQPLMVNQLDVNQPNLPLMVDEPNLQQIVDQPNLPFMDIQPNLPVNPLPNNVVRRRLEQNQRDADR